MMQSPVMVYLSCCNSKTSKNCPNDSALPAKMVARALDKKNFKQQMNYIVLVQIGNHFIQFVTTFLVRPSTMLPNQFCFSEHYNQQS